MKQYQLAMPQQVYSGETAMQALETLASGHEKAAVFTDAGIRASGILERPLAELDKAAVPYIINDTLPAEPTCDQAQQVIDTFRESNADLIVAVGGGSVMDIAKLASITADGSCTVRDQLKNPRIGKKTVTTVMIPTTAGTGSEATPNSIVAVPEEQLKVGIVNPEMIADAVILDGNMIRRLPRKIAASTGIDALCHAMSACATSGFSTKNASIAYFNSPAIDTILIFAMATAGVHFGLIYATVTGKRSNIFRSEVTRWYFGMLLAGGVLIAVSLFAADIYPTLTASFRYAMFQFVSVVTTTGFATADSNTWTSFAVILLIFGSIVCACAGSTAGGIKVNRLVLAGKMMRTRLRQQQHPNAIIRIRLDGVIQENEALHAVMIFIVTYLMFILAGTVFGTMLGVDLTTSFTGAVASMGNVGPGFGEVGSMDNFSAMPAAFKVSNSLLMLLGRLELMPILVMLSPRMWRER